MRVTKKREVRRGEILDVAEALFNENGFDATSTSQILEKAGIARGTLYHHFPSKAAIVDALVERMNNRILAAAKAIEHNATLPPPERLVAAVQALNVTDHGGGQLRQHIHKPGNALMHQKIRSSIVSNVTPILSAIVEDGIRQGTFSTPYPYEAIEMVIIYANEALDASALAELEPEQIMRRQAAILYCLERLLSATSGSLARLFASADAKDSPKDPTGGDEAGAKADAAPVPVIDGDDNAEAEEAARRTGESGHGAKPDDVAETNPAGDTAGSSETDGGAEPAHAADTDQSAESSRNAGTASEAKETFW